ncbi:MAG: tyrosine-type recombinase/integrase [Oscillospiraceae bacterium]|nr:tyrosine-type recombinase/integrase [Oscillospiraceae bacterium]
MSTITNETIQAFAEALRRGERAEATIAKYTAVLHRLMEFLDGAEVTKESLLAFRDAMRDRRSDQTVNGYISAVNSYLAFQGLDSLKLRLLRTQRQPFRASDRELTEAEYIRLVTAARRKKNDRIYHILITLAGTGIRVGELAYITVEAVERGQAVIRLKGKTRVILMPGALKEKLTAYIQARGILSGPVFVTRTGRPVDRSGIIHQMKALCREAEVSPRKVFPHNLRHLFARQFYAEEGNLAHLADVLGHSRLETTRLYVMSTEESYQRVMERLHLVI